MTAPVDVFAAAGLPDAPDRAVSLLSLIRAMHATPGTPAPDVQALREAVERAWTDAAPAGSVSLPLPLPRETFESLLRDSPRTPDDLLAALLRERRAALLYYGAMAMDADTRAFLSSRPDLVRDLADDDAGIVAAFGRSVRVANHRVLVPGGDEAVPLWEEIVGAAVTEPEEFLRRLIASREGRVAYMFDTFAHLDEPHQRFALGLWMPNAERRLDRLRIVLRAFTEVDREWSFADSPFGRPRHDAVLLLRLVPVAQDGAPAPPSWRALWNAAFESADLPEDPRREFGAVAGGGSIDAAMLVDQILLTPPPVRRIRFDSYAFGVRRFAGADASTTPDAVVALRAFTRYPAVMLGLERMGVATPAVYAAVARACERVEDIDDPRRGHVALAQFQAALAIVERAAWAGRIDVPQIEALVGSLARVEIRDGGYQGGIAEWMDATLLHALSRSANPDSQSPTDLERLVLTAMAGRSPDADGRRVDIEGLSYEIDVTAGDVDRFAHVRRRQGGDSLDIVLSAARQLRARGDGVRRQDVHAVERRLADVLIALVYAPHQGDPGELFPAAAALFRRHDFGLARPGVTIEARRRAPWERPRIADTAGQTHVQGSLLGIDLALARFSVRRLVSDRMPGPPTLNQNDREVVLETATLLNARHLTDARMHAIAAALRRGRERIAAARANASALDRLAETAGVSEVRRQVLSWMVSRRNDALEEVFTLAEVLRVGMDAGNGATPKEPSARKGPSDGYHQWGMTTEPLDGCYCLSFPDRSAWENFSGRPGAGQIAARLPDLTLRLAELLIETGMPAALLPATFAYAAQDFVDEAPALHTDDGHALMQQARALTRTRVEDYLAAVAARGPLRPIR